MTVTSLGERSLGSAAPQALAAQVELDAAIGVSLPEVQAKLAGALEAQARLTLTPPSLATNLAAALALVASLEASIAAGIPEASLDLTAIATIIAELQASLGALSASAAVSASFALTLGQVGIHLYRYDGQAGGLGSEFSAALAGGIGGGGPSQPVTAVVLAAADSGAIQALETLFAI